MRRHRIAQLLVLLSFVGAGLPEASAQVQPQSASGQPRVQLNRILLPPDMPDAARWEKHLKKTLAREARQANWGAGAGNTIEYRFQITELRFTREQGALRIHCTALGQLPGGQRARSELQFGGAPQKQNELIQQVLDVVARGVITRLAELERRRRGLN